MARQRTWLEQLREGLCRNLATPQTVGKDLSAPVSGSSVTLCEASCMPLIGRDVLGAAAVVFCFCRGWSAPGGCFCSPEYKPQM